MYYGPDGFDRLEMRALRQGHYDVIAGIIKERDEAERGYLQRAFSDYGEFWEYCLHRCPRESLGCAKRCELRRELKQPPFGSTYKLSGAITAENEKPKLRRFLEKGDKNGI